MNKQQVIERLEHYPEETVFPDDLFDRAQIPRLNETHEIYFDGVKMPFTKTPVYGFEVMEMAESQGLLKPYQVILIEELPNGTSRIIGQHDQIRLRDYMRLCAIGS